MEAIQSFDLSLLNAIQDSLKSGFLDGFTVFLSYLTNSGIIWIVALMITKAVKLDNRLSKNHAA